MDELVQVYTELGKKWLDGKVIIESFNCSCGSRERHKEQVSQFPGSCKGFWFNKKQEQYINSKDPEILICGGFRSGKTIAMIVKMYLLCMFFPDNRILLGRKTRSDIDSATLPAVFDVFPEGTYVYKIGPGIIEFPNGSQILLYGLDTSVSGDDTKKSTQKVKGLDLGAVFIDQLEEVEYQMYEHLTGRLSRAVPFHQMGSNTNPANFWAYDYFKVNPRKGTKLIETGMIDNKENLPDGFLENQLTKGEMYVRKFVHGEWSPDSMVEGGVFDAGWVKDQDIISKSPIREIDGIKIFEEPKKEPYQIGIDPSDGSVDPCNITVISKASGRVVATYAAYVPTVVIAQKAIRLGNMYSLSESPMMVPEATGAGQALVEELRRGWDNIYIRESFNRRSETKTQKLGFYTNFATKTQLIENMKKLFEAGFPKIYDKNLVEELKTFVYTDTAQHKGAGAQRGYHDDRVMGMMLAYWNVPPVFQPEDRLDPQPEFSIYASRFN